MFLTSYKEAPYRFEEFETQVVVRQWVFPIENKNDIWTLWHLEFFIMVISAMKVLVRTTFCISFFLYVFMVVLSCRIKRESGSSRHNNKFDTYCSFRACISSQHLTEVTVNRCSISQKLMIYWTREWIREWAFCRLITYWISLLNFKHEGLKHFTGKWHMSPYSSFLSCVDRSSENSLEW